MDNHKSWAVKDEDILGELTTLTKMTDEEKKTLFEIKGFAEKAAPEMVDAFYARLLAHENTAEYVGEKIEGMRNTLKTWFLELFSGEYGQKYVQGRLQIGKVHVMIGLPVRYPLAMMDVVMEYGQKAALSASNPELAAAAFRKLAALDIAIFNQAYESTQLKHLAKLVGNERLARRILTQDDKSSL
ncbi:MAG: Globin-coupled histidine kinase [Chlorobiales bacterium]|nr:Globin-coupled histidine kinase [Chlorobiales bacterium]